MLDLKRVRERENPLTLSPISGQPYGLTLLAFPPYGERLFHSSISATHLAAYTSPFALLEKGKSLISVIAKRTMRVILKRFLVSPRAITEPPSQGQELFDFDVDRLVRDFCHRHRSELRNSSRTICCGVLRTPRCRRRGLLGYRDFSQ